MSKIGSENQNSCSCKEIIDNIIRRLYFKTYCDAH